MTVIGYAPGGYDMFHVGHLNILRHARDECDVLIAGVVTDDVLFAAKGRRPVVPLTERLEIVRSVRFVDDAVVDPHVDKFDSWREFGFNVLFKGDDWRGTAKGAMLERRLATVGARVRYFPYTIHTSSTVLRTFLNSGEISDLGS